MKASSLFLVFIFALAVSVAGQPRTVTNNDLTRYKAEREKAELELREDFKRLGLPSPEERAKLNEKDAKEMSELAARLRASRIASEHARRVADAAAMAPPLQAIVVIESGVPVYYYPYQGGWYRYAKSRYPGQQQGYFAGGQFWPSRQTTRSRPARLFGKKR